MGHAEFEFDALPASLARIVSQLEKYRFLSTNLKSLDGKRLIVFTKDKKVPSAIKRFAERKNPNPYRDLKDPSYLEVVSSLNAGESNMPTFWWCIDSGDSRFSIYLGDWIAVFEDNVEDLLLVMANEKAKFEKLSDEEKQKLLNLRL
jgi:hypothetical protein